MLNPIKIFVASTGGRLLLLPATVTGLVGIVGIAKGLGLDMPGISWWAIAFFALLPISVWSIVGLIRKVTELDHSLNEIDDVLYSVTTSPILTVGHKKGTATYEINLGFNIQTSKPIIYEVIKMTGKLNGVLLPDLNQVTSKGSIVLPNENRWFKLPSAKFPWKPQVWRGEMDYELAFGSPSNSKKFQLKKKVTVEAVPGRCNESIVSEHRGLSEGYAQ